MLDLSHVLHHWGYLGIFVFVILGNVGLPVPEETVLVLAGYLVWEGRLRFSLVVAIGVLSAVIGDNLGYWFGREFGRRALLRYGHWILLTPERLEWTQRVVSRYGALAVFGARFLPGLRFLAGPVAGAMGLPAPTFMIANICGALVYVPAMAGIGYGIGYGLGERIARLERWIGRFEHLFLPMILGLTLLFFIRRAVHAYRVRRRSAAHDQDRGAPPSREPSVNGRAS
jgi:membrane protein DedA with SNARE-associated domain